MITEGQETLAQIRTPSVLIDQISQQHPQPTSGIIEEPLYTFSLQLTQLHSMSIGRYKNAPRQSDFRNIGRLVVLPAHMPLEVRSSGGLSQAVRCLYNQDTLRSYTGDPDFFYRAVPETCINLRHKRITDMLARLGQEIRFPGLASGALAEALGAASMIEFVRYLDDQPKDPFYRGGLTTRQFRRITEVIDAPEACPTLTELADLLELSVRHLTRAFKQSTGQTLYAHIEEVRFRKAQALLGDTDHLIKTIAFRLGFSCSGAFCNAFRRIAGETPQAYRKRIRRAKRSSLAQDMDVLETEIDCPTHH